MAIKKCREEMGDLEFATLRLKSTKTCRGLKKGVDVEIYEGGMTKLNPIRALKKYLLVSKHNAPNMPMFREESGLAYSTGRFNRDLKELLEDRVQYGTLSGHSFRIGMATLLAQNGVSDAEIMAIGRWASEAYETYIRKPRVTRVRMAMRLGRAVGLQ